MRSGVVQKAACLIRCFSVVKTTVLNALFRDKLNEVSLSKMPAGISFFRVISPVACSSSREKKEECSTAADGATQRFPKSSMRLSYQTRLLREASSIKEKWFNSILTDPLCEMCHDTSVAIVDIPGINEAGTNIIYMNYAEEKLTTFVSPGSS